MKKFLTYSVVVATIAWSLGISAVLPAAAAYSPVDGDLIKTATYPAVYYVSGGKKYLFVNRVTFGTWKDNFNGLKVISQTDFDALSLGGNVTARPGVSLIKFDNSDLVYAVTPSATLVKVDAATKTALYGSVAPIVIQSSFESNYTKSSATLTATSNYPDGSLVSNGGTTYLVLNGALQAVSGDAFTANAFKTGYVHAVSSISGYTVGSALTGKVSAVSDIVAGAGAGSTSPSAANLTVSIASDSPASGTVVTGQSTADLAHFVINNTGSTDVKITKIVLARTGVSADATLSNIYVFKGAVRLTDSASVSSGNITFTEFTAGIVTVPANGSVTLAIKSDIASGSAGQTVGVKMVSVNDSSFSAVGNVMSVASATDLATASTTASTTVSATTDPVSEFVVWGNTIQVNGRDVNFSRLALREVGSINASDLSNFKLYVDGNLVASASNLDSNGYVTFAPSSAYTLKTGSRTFKVVADITGGASRTFQFSLKGAYDIGLADTSYGVGIPLGYSSSASQWTCGQVTVNSIQTSGVTVEKASDSPASDVVKGASDVLLAKYYLTTYGESVKIDTLAFNVTSSKGALTTLRNARVVINGNQVGSTANLVNTAAGTSFTVNTTLNASTKYTLEVRADIYDNDGTDSTADADTLKISMIAGSSNAQGKTSGLITSVPSSAKDAGTVTIDQGGISIDKLSSYGTQTIVPPQTAYKIGAFVVTGNSSEAINLNNINVDFGGTGSVATNLTDVYLKYNGKESSRKSSVSSSSNSFSISETVAVNGSMTVDIYANIGSLTTLNFYATTTISGTSAVSGQSATANVRGQTIQVGAASFSVSSIGGIDDKLVVTGSTEDAAKIEFKALNDSYKLESITVTTTDATSALGISQVIVKDGATEIARTSWAGTSRDIVFATPVNIPAGSSNAKTLTIALVIAGVNSDNAGQNTRIALSGYKVTPSSGSSYTTTTNVVGKNIYAFKTKPTVTIAAGDTTLAGGTKALAKVTITGEQIGGTYTTIAWSRLIFTMSTSGAYTLSNLTLKDSGGSTIGTIAYAGGALGPKATTSMATGVEEKFSGSKTYTLYGDIGGTIASGDSLGVAIARPSTSVTSSTLVSSLTWSDLSNDSHTTATSDWWSDYLVKDLPTTSVSLNKL